MAVSIYYIYFLCFLLIINFIYTTPTKQPIETTTPSLLLRQLVTCSRPDCVTITCNVGYRYVYDSTGCSCPYCELISTSSSTPSTVFSKSECPLITCGPGYVAENPPGDICPYCEKITTSTSTTHRIICSKPPCYFTPITCEEGYTLVEDPTFCNCPTCERISTTQTQVSCSRSICPKILCIIGYTRVEDPTECTCPKCVPTTTTAFICSPPPCSPVQCKEGYHVVYDPKGCTCPTCQPISTTTCIPPPCAYRECPEGYELVSGPARCTCPTCQPKTTTKTTTQVMCTSPNCPEITCPGTIIYDPTGCKCPLCDTTTTSTTSTTSTTTKRKCNRRKYQCPAIKCREGYRVYNDPTNCRCPTCQRCPVHDCPYIARICDPNNPPPRPQPCGCPIHCIYPTTEPHD